MNSLAAFLVIFFIFTLAVSIEAWSIGCQVLLTIGGVPFSTLAFVGWSIYGIKVVGIDAE